MNTLGKAIFFLFLPFCSFSLLGQNQPGLYLDCQTRCDFSYIKQEIRFVNYMMNRQDADIYVLATSQRTGAGGRAVQLVFIGSNQFAGMNDTLEYFVEPNYTDAIYRERLVKGLKKGLLIFMVETPLMENIEYNIVEGLEMGTESEEEETEDPWDFWVFNVGGDANMDGEQLFRSMELSARLSASRITDQHKFRFWGRYNYEKSTFTLTDGEQFDRLIERYNAEAEYVKSLGPHWSAGFNSEAGSSTFGNTDLTASIKPALEFNIFPYEEAQTRRFSFLYSIGPEYYNYTDTTVYDKMEEVVFRHGLRMEFEQTQQWGSIEVDMGVQQFFHNLSLYSAYINPDIELQIFKGLRVDVGGYVSLVTDRINIAKSDISDEDILLQIKQLDTNFTYFSYIGLNYRFGSKFNNFVNPRF
jgi:hypothetical protein